LTPYAGQLPANGVPDRLAGRGLSPGKHTRLARVLYQHGVGNGTALVLPYDQGLEHGPRDFFAHPSAGDPAYIMRLALEGGFNAVAVQIGIAEKYAADLGGQVPLLLKLNGKTELPDADAPLSPLTATVEDAVRLGADAVGYTLYVGSSRQDEDFTQFRRVRADADRLGMPVVVWAYPRGSAVARAGGQNSLYAVDYAARVAAELGADVVKVNFPDPTARDGVRPEYDRDFSPQEAVRRVVASAGRALVLLSGGEKDDDDAVLGRTRLALQAGATGVIYGRNVWQREHSDALRLIAALRDVLAEQPARRGDPA
jgi:class I fructose-bisphosphate aldolase